MQTARVIRIDRSSNVVTMPKRLPIDWSIVALWSLIAIFGTVEIGCVVFGLKAFLFWVGSKLEGMIP